MTESQASERAQRERAFHDDRYAHEHRQRAQRFYSVTHDSTTAYQRAIRVGSGGRDVLEYGCGTGSAAFDLAVADQVTGIDISPVAISEAEVEARRQGVTASFREMNAEALDFGDGSFDLVCGTGILHHLDLEVALAEVARVLRPDGRAVFSEPMGHNPLINAYRRRTPEMRTEDEHPILMPDFDIARRRFSDVSLEFFHLTVLAAAPLGRLPGHRMLTRFLAGLDRAIFRLLPPLRRYAWIVVIELRNPIAGGT